MADGFRSLALLGVGGLGQPDLFGIASDTASATGNLSSQIPLAGGAADVAQATGDLFKAGFTSLVLIELGGFAIGTQSQIQGQATDTVTATGSLKTGAKFSGAAQDTASASGELFRLGFFSLVGLGFGDPPPANLIIGGAAVASTATGDLTKGGFRSPTLLGNIDPWILKARFAASDPTIPFAGDATDTASATGALYGTSPISGAAADSASAGGNLSTGIQFRGDADASASAHGTLTGGVAFVVSVPEYTAVAAARSLSVVAAARSYIVKRGGLMLSPKDPAETVPVTFDFSHLTSVASNPQITVAVAEGTDPTPDDIILDVPTVSGALVIQKFYRGVMDVTYHLRCEIDGIGGAHWVLTDLLKIEAAQP